MAGLELAKALERACREKFLQAQDAYNEAELTLEAVANELVQAIENREQLENA